MLKKCLWLLLFALFVTITCVLSRNASAIPTFARSYRTSCSTCHVVFPRLTAFGEAFRRNGYQFPEGTDPEYLKEEPVSLGAEAYKQVFPDAIWPGAIPHLPPVSIITEGEFTYSPEAEEQKLSFDGAVSELEMLMAGNIGENISFFWELDFAEDQLELDMGSISFSNILASHFKPYLLNLRIGKFVPEFVANSHRSLIASEPWLATKNVGNNQWTLLDSQKGIELNGIVSGHLDYDLGVLEGRENLPNSDKDIYAHIAYKMGGMRIDGVTGDKSLVSSSKPWRDDSVTVDGFAYFGAADILVYQPGVNANPQQEDNFQMYGGDINVMFKDLNLISGFALEHDSQPTASKEPMDAIHIFSEATYVVYPWLVPLVRFELFDLEDVTDIRVLPMVNFLIRANLKAIIAMEIEREGANGSMELSEIEAALSAGF